MSADVGILIRRTKSGKIFLKEVCLSTGEILGRLGVFKNAEDALMWLEGDCEDYEALMVSGFRRLKRL